MSKSLTNFSVNISNLAQPIATMLFYMMFMKKSSSLSSTSQHTLVIGLTDGIWFGTWSRCYDQEIYILAMYLVSLPIYINDKKYGSGVI